MLKLALQSLRRIAIAALIICAYSHAAIAARDRPNILGIFGVVLNNALANQMRDLWLNPTNRDYDCLTANDMTAEQLAAPGIGPSDPRTQRLSAECVAATKGAIAPAAATQLGDYNPDFAVSGLAPGGSVNPESSAYQAYRCKLSDEFSGYKWCTVKHPMTGKFGPYDSWVTVLHSNDNIVVFVLQDMLPAYFAPGDVEREIQRLSKHFGHAARVLTGDPRPEAPHSLIAVWGDLTLSPLDQSTMDALRRDETITSGLVIDFFSDSKRSAKEGMPVFQMGGGAGYIYAVKFDDSGKGRLRIVSVNPNLLASASQVSSNEPVIAQSLPPVERSSPAPSPIEDSARAEKERTERVNRATVAAKAQLADAGVFIQEHPQSPNLLDYLDRIAALSKAVASGDPDQIDRKSTELSNVLIHDKDFQQHVAAAAEAQKKRDAQYLGDAIRHGEQQRNFILGYIGKNPLAEATANLTSYAKQLNAALLHPNLSMLQELVNKIDLAIREDNLANDFIAAQSEGAQATAARADKNSEAAPNSQHEATGFEPLPATDKNRFLFEGNLGDVAILYNASPEAPHIARNLRGDFVFDQSKATVCLFGRNPEGFALTVEGAIAKTSPQSGIGISIDSCDAERLMSYDIIATQRNAFLRTKRDDALAVLKVIETGSFKVFAEITAADLDRVAASERALIDKVKTNVSDGAPDGFGVVIIESGSPNLCLAVGDKIRSHQQLLIRAESKLNREMRAEVVIKTTSIDEAFLKLQRRLCGAVYGSAADLKPLTEALTRNEIAYTFSSLWILPAEVDAEDAAVAERDRAVAQEETERLQRNADQVKLASARAHDLNATQAAQQAALRQKFGNGAKAAAATLSAEIAAWTLDKKGQTASTFPAYAAFASNILADHWEVMSIDNGLEDFGTSTFKGRALDTIFARITVHLKNRMLGEYQDACFIFGRVNDVEFSMSREPVSAKCDDEATIQAWQAGHQFQSEWIASN